MAGDVPGIDPHTATSFIGWLGGLATATIGGIGLWMAQRVLGKAAFQTAMNDGFAKLTAELQEERATMKAEMAVERNSVAAERIAWADERTQLKGRIRQLEQTVQGLERRLGIEPSHASDAEAGSTQL